MLKTDKMEIAKIFAKQSKCKRKQVGCIIMRSNRVIVSGYNGTIAGTCNKCENDDGTTKDTVIHAEVNAITYAARNGINIKDTELYVTLSPCINCAKLILASGIRSVTYLEQYRCTTGIEFLNKNGVACNSLM